MASIADFRSYTSTPARRNTFYNYCSQQFAQESAIFFILVEAFRVEKRKRQAVFLNDWFILGSIPTKYTDSGYLAAVNISGEMQETTGTNASAAVSAIGLTFSNKMTNHGGGVRGFFGAVRQKMGDTTISGTLFDAPQRQAWAMLNDQGKGFGGEGGQGGRYQPDHKYQSNGAFSAQAISFRKDLKANGFDPDTLGIY